MTRLFILTFLCWCALWASAENRTYRSGNIKTAITKLGLANIADTLPCGLSTLKYNGIQIVMKIDDSNEVVSIGIPLFSKTLRNLQPSPIYDFMEYALLDRTFSISDNPFRYKSLKFLKGSWRDLRQVNDSTPVSIDNIDGKHYRITWSNGKNVIAKVMFPIQYDMLSRSIHHEMEENFIRDLKRHIAHATPLSKFDTKHIGDLELCLADGNDRYYINRGECLYTENITDNTYYRMGEDSVCHLLYDMDYPAETLCNMLLTGSESDKRVAVTVMKHDFTQEAVLTNVSALASFLKANGCKSFFGLRKSTDKELSFSLYARNMDSGYIHLFIFTCSTRNAIDSTATLNAKAFLYIPTSNIKSLFK